MPYARIGGGTALGVAYRELAPYGLTIPGGTCPTVSVGGLAQGGGLGWVARRWGPLSDNVQGFRIVTADGRLREVNARSERDLFWACRGGGGGNFGVITSYDIRTHPTDPATHFVLSFPWADAPDVVLAWQEWAHRTGPEMFTLCSLVTSAGGANPICQVSGQVFGDQAALNAELAPFLAQVTPSGRSITPACTTGATSTGSSTPAAGSTPTMSSASVRRSRSGAHGADHQPRVPSPPLNGPTTSGVIHPP